MASSLYVLFERRGNEEYLATFPEFLDRVRLPMDVDLRACNLLPAPPVVEWMEAEVWHDFVDMFEATIGAETESLMRLRGQDTLTDEQRNDWRDWAIAFRSQHSTQQRDRARSRSPRRTEHTDEGSLMQTTQRMAHGRDQRAKETETEAGDDTCLMHRNSRLSNGDRRRSFSRRRRQGRPRSRSRGGWWGDNRHMGPRERRIEARMTEETRRLEPRACSWRPEREAEGTESAPSSGPARPEPRGPPPTLTRPTRAETEQMDILQATGKWFQVFGLRQEGEEQLEPANALTRGRQQAARQLLRPLSEQNIIVMYHALLRLMGMLFIEGARIVMDVHDERRRGTEEVEIEIEEDDESLYVQTTLTRTEKTSWGVLLERLVRLADVDAGANHGLTQALLRRISQSLFLQTQRGVQLQAALIAVTSGRDFNGSDICETLENDDTKVAEWWDLLKGYMDLGGDSGARGSEDNGEPGPPMAYPGAEPTQLDIDAWEGERIQIQVESQEEERLLRDREDEEHRQEEQDRALFEAHQAAVYKDWENWAVLHTPTIPKRRRLTLTATSNAPSATDEDRRGVSASITVPRSLDGLQLGLQIAQEPDLPDAREDASTMNEGALRFGGPVFERAHLAWKKGWITDAGVEAIFEKEWLFFFLASEVDTMPADTRPSADGELRDGDDRDGGEPGREDGLEQEVAAEDRVNALADEGVLEGDPGELLRGADEPEGEGPAWPVTEGGRGDGRWTFPLRGGTGEIVEDLATGS